MRLLRPAAAAMVRFQEDTGGQWPLCAEFGRATGGVRALKTHYPAIAPDVVAAGLLTVARMPCVHPAFCGVDGWATCSMPDTSLMAAPYLHMRQDKAVITVRPAFAEVLYEVPDAN